MRFEFPEYPVVPDKVSPDALTHSLVRYRYPFWLEYVEAIDVHRALFGRPA